MRIEEEIARSLCINGDSGIMTHAGVPATMTALAILLITATTAYVTTHHAAALVGGHKRSLVMRELPLIGPLTALFDQRKEPLLVLKFLSVALFLLIITAGLIGTPLGARNLATSFTWTLWWSLVILSIPLLGTAWCAVCPWDTLASWLVRWRLWGKRGNSGGLDLKPPRWMRNLWPAATLFIFLSWLELGTGLTDDPAATAMLSLGMLLIAILFLAVFQRKTFCRYLCPVGRTVGCYAQLSVVELRPVEQNVCDDCRSLDCYHGNEHAEPCPTRLTMGRLTQNTYCLSCGACSTGCPKQNVSWHLRPLAREAAVNARPHWDEAWFMLILLVLTSFHGITMIPQWAAGLDMLGDWMNTEPDSLWVFTLAMLLGTLPLLLPYGIAIALMTRTQKQLDYRRLFGSFAFTLLPIAFAYHLAHNLGHLVHEGGALPAVIVDPFGSQIVASEQLLALLDHGNMLLPAGVLAGLQTALLLGGHVLGLQIMRQRLRTLAIDNAVSRLIIASMLGMFSLFNLWLLAQPMNMRM